MGILGTVGVVWAAVKTFREIAAFAASLNGWAVLFILSALALLACGVVAYVEWLNKRFARQELVITDLSRRLLEYDANLSKKLRDLTDAITADCEQRLKKEIDSRAAGEITDRNRMNDAETRIVKMEGWFKSKNVSL